MAKPLYLLDLPVLGEITRPNGNRRVFNLFQQRQAVSALSAPAVYALARGIEALPDNPRHGQLASFLSELMRAGPPVLPFTGDAAVWLAKQAPRWDRAGRAWTRLDGEQAAIAAVNDLAWVTRMPTALSGVDGVRIEDWFKP